MNNKKIPTLIGTTVLIIIAITAGMFVWKYEENQGEIQTDVNVQRNQKPPSTPKACPALAKLCPDGSSVTATGPNCEFAACPTTQLNK